MKKFVILAIVLSILLMVCNNLMALAYMFVNMHGWFARGKLT